MFLCNLLVVGIIGVDVGLLVVEIAVIDAVGENVKRMKGVEKSIVNCVLF
jgi:hypothetical protein